MAKNNYYAVKVGKEPGIYQTWAECEAQVKGVPGAIYKGFKELSSAEKFILEGEDKEELLTGADAITNEDINRAISEMTSGEVIAFVDGSYSDTEKKIGFGVIIIDDVGVETTLYRAVSEKYDAEIIKMRNFAAELLGAIDAIEWAVSYKKKKITIYYDYDGIEKFASREWKAKNDLSKKYLSFIEEKKHDISIQFVKVTGHSGIEYNDRVDALAKRSLLEKGYKTYHDGSVYFVGFSADDWRVIVECIEEENEGVNGSRIKFDVSNTSEGKQRIEITYGNNKVVVNCYKNSKSYVQGKQSPLFEKVILTAISFLTNDEEVVETLNKLHVLSITKEEVEIAFESVLPDYNGERDGKHYNNLLSAIYNTKIVGYMPDYTCLVTPIFRAYEKYLHTILGEKMGLDTCRENGTNNFAYFSKNSSGAYECNSNKVTKLTNDQIDYLNNLYTRYHAIRHQYSHWSAEDYDSAVITDLSVAKQYLNEGLTIINNYYILF